MGEERYIPLLAALNCGRDCYSSNHYIYLYSKHFLPLSRFSCVQLCATPYTAAHQAPLSLGFSRQEYWSGLPFPSPNTIFKTFPITLQTTIFKVLLILVSSLSRNLPSDSSFSIFYSIPKRQDHTLKDVRMQQLEIRSFQDNYIWKEAASSVSVRSLQGSLWTEISKLKLENDVQKGRCSALTKHRATVVLPKVWVSFEILSLCCLNRLFSLW